MYFSNPPRPASAPTRTNWKRAFAELLANTALSAKDRATITSMHTHWAAGRSMTRGRKSFFYLIQERTERAAIALAERASGGATAMSLRLSALNDRIDQPSSWDAGFVESLMRQEAQGRNLSASQIETLEKVEARFTDEILAERAAWVNGGYGETERECMLLALTYYATTQYFMGPRADFFQDDDYIPSYEVYDKIVNNKYAQKVVTAFHAEPKFAAGSMVQLRANTPTHRRRQTAGAHLRSNVVCIVISTSEPIISAAKGCKRYKVLPVGSAETFLVEERDLKIHR